MFDFLRQPGMRRPSAAVRRALAANDLPSDTVLDELGVVTSRGLHAGREVTFFRVFDPRRAVAHAINVFTDYAYQDLNAHLELVLGAGFVEQDGTVVLFTRPPRIEPGLPARERAVEAANGSLSDGNGIVDESHTAQPTLLSASGG